MEDRIITTRWVLGLEYDGQPFLGWQSQPNGQTVQDQVERALALIACHPVRVICAGRTDTGVHALSQIIHFDTHASRSANAWVRGVNRHLPAAIRVLWAQPVDNTFHARFSAQKRSYRYVLYSAPVRPALYQGKVGWTHDSMDEEKLRQALSLLRGQHDFSAFRSAQCQAKSPVKIIYDIKLIRKGPFWIFDFEASGFLHHMIRNLMGTLVAIGRGSQPVIWIQTLLHQKDRRQAAPTFSAQGLYLSAVDYPEPWIFPEADHILFD